MPIPRNANRTKTVYGTSVRRSEYEDAILRTNSRTENKLQSDLHYHDRAQKVIMKDLGKQSFILQNKIDNSNKPPSYGSSRYGGASASPGRRYSSDSPTGKLFANSSRKNSLTKPFAGRSNFVRSPTKMPSDRENEALKSESPVHGGASMSFSMAKQDRRFSSPMTSHVTSLGQKDDYLASMLNETLEDAFQYSHGVHVTPTYKLAAARPSKDEVDSVSGRRRVSVTNTQNGRGGD